MALSLSADDKRAFAASVVEVNRKRMRVLLPLMLVMHAAMIWMFSTSKTMDGTPAVALWRDEIVAIHEWTLPPVALLGLALWFLPRHPFARFFAPLAAATYLCHAAAIVGADQLTLTNMTVFIGYAFGIAVVVVASPAQALLVYGVGLAAAFGSMYAMQPDDALRTGMLASATTSVAVSVVMSSLLYGARRRDFTQRLTIDRQRAELEAVNSTLEERVRARVHDIEVLNAALQAQVRERSSELSFALARLAQARGTDGALKEGTVLGERFELTAKLGEGGMGAVYSALDRTSGARVALKVIHASSARQVSLLQRFLDEARVVATLTHPAIVKMIHVDVSADGLLFQAQELVEGETLEKHLQRGSFTPAQSARVGAVLADALASAHASGVVHRDVKPSNVMLTSTSPGLKLLDFGIAKLSDRAGHAGSRAVTGAGVVVGTPAYMAPEQLEGDEVTGAADAWAVGVVLHRMLTGSLPSRDPATVPPPTRARDASGGDDDDEVSAPQVPRALTALVERCLSHEAHRRPALREIADALARIADDGAAPPLEQIATASGAREAHEVTVSMTARRPSHSTPTTG